MPRYVGNPESAEIPAPVIASTRLAFASSAATCAYAASKLRSRMPRKPAHEQFDTLQAIRDEAFTLFGRYGYDGVSIGDIAKAAKLTKGALYWHFHGKDELYLECL